MEQPPQDLEGQTVTYAEPQNRRQSQFEPNRRQSQYEPNNRNSQYEPNRRQSQFEPNRRQSQYGTHIHIDTGNGVKRGNSNFRRQKSLVRPERERVDRNHPQYFYRNVTQNLDGSHVKVQPSTTGTDPTGQGVPPRSAGVRRGKSVLGREIEKPGHVRTKAKGPKQVVVVEDPLKKKEPREWPSKWIVYYNAITCCFPAAILKSCGK